MTLFFTLVFCSCSESLTTTYTSAPHPGPICGSRHLGLANPMCCGLECAVYSWQRSSKIAVISHYSNSVIYLTLHIHRFPIWQSIQMMNRIICVPLSLSTPPAVTAQKNNTSLTGNVASDIWITSSDQLLVSQARQHVRYPSSTPPYSSAQRQKVGVLLGGSGQPNWVTRSLVPLWPLL